MHIIFHISCGGTWCRIWWYFSIFLLQIIRLLLSGRRGGQGCRQPWSSFCYSADCPPPCPRCTCWGQSSCGHLSWLCRSPAWMRQWGAFYRPGCLISWGSSEIWSPACPACGFCAMKPTQGWNRTRPRTGLLLTIRGAPTSGERCPVDRGRWSWRGSKANFMHVFSISAWKVLVFIAQPHPRWGQPPQQLCLRDRGENWCPCGKKSKGAIIPISPRLEVSLWRPWRNFRSFWRYSSPRALKFLQR